VVKVPAIHSTVKNLPLVRDEELSHTTIEGLFAQNCQDVPITSQISKENFEIIKKLQKRRISLCMVCTCSQIERIYKSQTQYSCRVGLSWPIPKIEPNCKMLERIQTRNARKLKWAYNTVVMLVGTSNGCWNLGRKIKNCLFVRLDNDNDHLMIIKILWWSSMLWSSWKLSEQCF